MDARSLAAAERLYLSLTALFIAALVTGNLIFQKFFFWNPLGLFAFELSVGILPYPITFLVTDIVSEVYGKRRSQQVVVAGLVASVFTLFVVTVADLAPATEWSPVQDDEFRNVFGFTFLAVAASMAAYLTAQFIDVQVFHFWKNLTGGKHLWLRNNASTLTSQFIDTIIVLLLLCSFGVIEWSRFGSLFVNGFLFKAIIALLDTPFVYLGVHPLRRRFGLVGVGQELRDPGQHEEHEARPS